MKKENNTIVLVDAFSVIHRAYHALPNFTTEEGKPVGAVYGFVSTMLRALDEFSPEAIIACFDSIEKTHRQEVYEDYKAGRKEMDDELEQQIELVKDACEALDLLTLEKGGSEADDIIGTLAGRYKKEGKNVIIVTIDQDLLQLIEENVEVWLFRKGIKDILLLDESEANKFLGFSHKLLPDYKALAGDASDNIKGVKGIGKKTATDLVLKFGTIEELYKKVNDEDFPFTARVQKLLVDSKKDAEFSKEMATIHRDVSVNLPKTLPKPVSDKQKAIDFFNSLNFKAFAKKFSGGETSEKIANVKVANETSDEFIKSAIAFWLLDSERINPSEEDILSEANAKNLEEAFDVLKKRVDEEGMGFVLEKIELPLIPVIKKMEKEGIKLDVKELQKNQEKYNKELEKIEKEIFKLTESEFNVNSPKQVSEIIFDKLKLGKGKNRSTRESALQEIIDKHPAIPLILKYREIKKLLSTYIEALPKLVGDDGRLHTTFIQYGTSTGRMSSKNPNLQNIPVRSDRGGDIRKAFVAKEGHLLVSLDYSQIEFRVAGILAKDKELLEILESGKDVHTQVAEKMFKVSAVDKDQRNKAKTITYGILYGMGVNALRRNLKNKVSIEEARELFAEYTQAFPKLMQYREESINLARKKGYSETFFGRRRYLPDLKSTLSYVSSFAERIAINAPIQGTQAEVMKIAMCKCDELIEKSYKGKAFMLLQIHDELLFEVEKSVVEKFTKDMVEIMENATPKLGVFPVDSGIGASWFECKS